MTTRTMAEMASAVVDALRYLGTFGAPVCTGSLRLFGRGPRLEVALGTEEPLVDYTIDLMAKFPDVTASIDRGWRCYEFTSGAMPVSVLQVDEQYALKLEVAYRRALQLGESQIVAVRKRVSDKRSFYEALGIPLIDDYVPGPLTRPEVWS